MLYFFAFLQHLCTKYTHNDNTFLLSNKNISSYTVYNWEKNDKHPVRVGLYNCLHGVTSVLLSAKYDEIETQLVDDFKASFRSGDKKRMKRTATLLSHFKAWCPHHPHVTPPPPHAALTLQGITPTWPPHDRAPRMTPALLSHFNVSPQRDLKAYDIKFRYYGVVLLC